MFSKGLRERINTGYVEKLYTRGQTLPKKLSVAERTKNTILQTLCITTKQHTMCILITNPQSLIKVPIAPNWKGTCICLQNTSKSHSYHLKIWQLL